MDGRITALETFNQNAASKDDLTAYVAHSELAGLVDNEVLELLKDNGSIAKYVNEVIESQVLAETSAINLAIKGVDDKLATLSTSFETYKSEQATAYQTVTSNITTLTTFKTTIETALAVVMKILRQYWLKSLRSKLVMAIALLKQILIIK